MKQITALLATLLISQLINAQVDSTKPAASKKILYEGTIVTVKLLNEISSKTANEGDIIEFETTEPIIEGDRVLVQKGAKVSGQVTESAKAKGLGKAGKLNFTIDYLTVGSGKKVKLTSELKAEGKSKTGASVAQAVLLTPLFLLKKGKNIKFEAGHVFKVFVESDTEIE